MKKRIVSLLLALVMVFALCACGSSQQTTATDTNAADTSAPAADAAPAEEVNYPTKEITLVVPFAAGGGNDLVARLFAEYAKKYCDQPFVIVNQGGGGGVPATAEHLAKPADGYTVIYAASAPTCTQAILSDIPYDITTDIDFLCETNEDPLCIVVAKDCPANNMDEFVTWATENELTFGANNGGVHYFAALAMMNDLGIRANYVPTEGGADSLAKLLGGHVDYVTVHPNEVLSSYTSGETKIISVMADERLDILPDAPTCIEQGYNYSYSVLKGFIARPGMDAGVREKLVEICKNVLTDEEFIAKCADIGSYIEYKSGEDYKSKNVSDFETFSAAFAAVNG